MENYIAEEEARSKYTRPNKGKIGNLPEKGCRLMAVKMRFQ